MLKRSRALASVAIVAVVTGMGAPVWAETLQEAIALAYRTNPSLLAQRANQRALDESIVQARAGLRPSLDVTISGAYTRDFSDGPFVDSDSDNASASIGLSQTLWSGGRIGHGITAAEAEILAGRENLRDIEQTVLASVIQAYADVIRDTDSWAWALARSASDWARRASDWATSVRVISPTSKRAEASSSWRWSTPRLAWRMARMSVSRMTSA